MITNGWSYIAFAISIWLNINWLKVVSSSYIAILYFPFTMEKIITIPLAIFFQIKLFPRDKKLHQQLVAMKEQVYKEWFALRFRLKWRKYKKWLS